MLLDDRDSLRDEVAFLHRQAARLNDELRVVGGELAEKSKLLADAEKRLEDASDMDAGTDSPAVVTT